MKKLVLLLAVVLINGLDQALCQSDSEVHFGLGKANVIRYSPVNDIIAISIGNKIKLFKSGIQIASLKSGHGKVTALDFHPDGTYLAAGHHSGQVSIWQMNSRALLTEFSSDHYSVINLEFQESLEKIVVLNQNRLSAWSFDGNQIFEVSNHHGSNLTMDLSPHGEFIIVVDDSGRIAKYDASGQIIIEMRTDQKRILSSAVSMDESLFATGAVDGTVHLWDLKEGQFKRSLLDTHGRINSLEFSNNDQYVAAGGEYFFILSLTPEHPDVVYKKLNGAVLSTNFNPNGKEICIIEDLTPHAQIFDISDLNIPPTFKLRDENDVIAPQIYVSNPPKIVNDRLNTSLGMIDIQGSIFDDFGVRSLWVNGTETPIKENGKFIIHLPLAIGENPISLEARDINGNIAMKKFIINRKDHEESYDFRVAKNFLFVVGIDQYQYWPQLNNAVRDGNDLAKVLMDHYNFNFSDITFLKDEQATRGNIYNGLRSMIEKVSPQDNLIIYFSGHGQFDELLNEGYWIPSDARNDTPGDYLSNTSILKIVENIESQHTLLMADACFSGSLFSDNYRGSGYYEKIDQYRSRWGLASGRLEAVSDGNLGSNSPFSKVLLNFLRDVPKSEFAISELIQYVKMNVAETSSQTPIGNPLRIRGEEGGEFIFRKTYITKELTSSQ